MCCVFGCSVVPANPRGSIKPPFGPREGSIEPQLKGVQNHRQVSIESFASSPPLSGYPFKTLPIHHASGSLEM